jgi:sugar transferase (PEP-CTERM/EpsH1 system associated)
MNNEVNIMHIVFSLECGGLEKIAIELSAKLNSGVFNSCICCIDTFGELSDEAMKRGVEVILIKRKPGKDITLPFRLARLIKKKRIDLVHTHNMGPLFYGTLAGKLAGVPVIMNTRHGREKKRRNSYIWNMNAAVIAISEDAKKEMLKWNRIDTKKMKVIYNGIDIGRYSNRQNGSEVKNELNIKPSTLVVGTVARLCPEKDQFTLIGAFSKVVNKIDTAKLIFVGDGILREELNSHAEKLGISHKVMFLGFRNDIYNILPAFDVFALSSFTEGVSLTLLEAMAMERPIVATNVGGNPEVVVDGVTGFLVPPKESQKMADAIVKLLHNPELAQKMGEAGRRRVEEKFSLERMVKEYKDLYEECLAKKGISV